MSHLSDLIKKAKTGKSLTEVLGLSTDVVDPPAGVDCKELTLQLAELEAIFSNLSDQNRCVQLPVIIAELENLAKNH